MTVPQVLARRLPSHVSATPKPREQLSIIDDGVATVGLDVCANQ